MIFVPFILISNKKYANEPVTKLIINLKIIEISFKISSNKPIKNAGADINNKVCRLLIKKYFSSL